MAARIGRSIDQDVRWGELSDAHAERNRDGRRRSVPLGSATSEAVNENSARPVRRRSGTENAACH